jgi:hypothetical protein
MTPDMEALASRAVACKGWRFMEGMRTVDRVRIYYVGADGSHIGYRNGYELCEDGGLPDLTDPATLGCLLALVREAWGDPHASVWYDSAYLQSGNRWSWHAKEHSLVDYDTEAEALVCALEAYSTTAPNIVAALEAAS